MRKALFVGLSAMLVGAAFAAPVSAQGASAGGSCGYQAGQYGQNMLSPDDIRNPSRGAMNIGTIHVQVEYSGVGPGTILTIVPTSGSSNSGPDLGATGASRNVTAQDTAGTVAFSVSQNEGGATQYQSKGRGVGGEVKKSGKGSSKNAATQSAGQSNGEALYFFQTWADGKLIGTFTCGVEDA